MSATNETLIEFVRGWGFTGLADAMAAADASAALTPLGMFMDADWVVKSVMLGLIVASVLAWAVWAGKLVQIAAASARLGLDYRRLAAHGQLGADLAKRGAVARMQGAAEAEVMASDGLATEGIKTRTAADLARIEAGAARAMQGGIMVIGSIGSTAPFIGLFGTVWGIMNAFVGISESGSTNLAVVAPGIAEALMATAIGLIAAIPAVLFYNHLTRVIGGYRARLADAVSLVERTLSRDLDRRAVRPSAQIVAAEIVALAAE